MKLQENKKSMLLSEEQKEPQVTEDKETTAMKYRDSGIDERILRAVEEMGYDNMTPIQEQTIPVFLSGKDVIGQAQTGTGKTAAFGIPILEKINPEDKSLQALILCPTRELAMQAADELRKFAKYMHGIKVLPIYGGQDIIRQIKNLKGGVQIIVGTPGRVMDHMRRHTVKLDQIHTVVLDEADEMLNMGFREDIETILKEVPEERQTGLFSATMPAPILEITKQYQKDAVFLKMTPKEVTISLVKQAYYHIQRKDKEEVLCRLIDYYDPKRALIFCNTKRMVDDLTEHLKQRGYAVEGLHGDLTQYQRDTVMNLFKSGHAALLIATDVAARGIDIDNVEAVFNYDVPEDIEYYVHRIGRTGRAGKKGRSFTLVTGREIYKLREIERVCHTRIRERNIPSAADVMAKKADKILSEAENVILEQDMERALGCIRKRIQEGEYDALQYAAAFMKMRLGDDIEDIRLERAPEWLRKGRGKRNGENRFSDRDRRPQAGKTEKSGKEKKNGSFEKPGREKRNGSFEKSGKTQKDRQKKMRSYTDKDGRELAVWGKNSLRIKTKKQS